MSDGDDEVVERREEREGRGRKWRFGDPSVGVVLGGLNSVAHLPAFGQGESRGGLTRGDKRQ